MLASKDIVKIVARFVKAIQGAFHIDDLTLIVSFKSISFFSLMHPMGL